MPAVTVVVPGLLAGFTGGRRSVTVEADTVAGSVDRLLAAHPALRPHLLDDAGRPRDHLRLFHEGTAVEWEAAGAVEVAGGDRVVVLQAVSGG